MKRTLTAVLTPALLGGLLVASGGAPATAAEPAGLSRSGAVITGTTAQFVEAIPGIEPIKAGYKGTNSFLPPSVAMGKDARGCNLRQQWLISSAYVKPKVGRKCTLTGGVWWVNGGTKKVTKSKDVYFQPTLDYGDAWGQGASQWTPQQREAWATSVERGVPATAPQTRAKGVSTVPATQRLLDKSTFNAVRYAGYELEDNASSREEAERICRGGLDTAIAILAGNMSVLLACWDKDYYAERAPGDRKRLDWACDAAQAQVSNVLAWGLSLRPDEIQTLLGMAYRWCPSWTTASRSLVNEAKGHGITPIPQPEIVNTSLSPAWEGIGPVGRGPQEIITPFANGYSGGTGSATADRTLFGIAAPVDWGAPGVPVGYLRLWDAGVSWRQMQPDGTKPIDWSKMDLTVQMASRIGARVMYVLGDTPAWANGGKEGNVPPSNLQAAADFIGQMCSRYGGAVSSYEVWNEGNLTTFWTGSMDELADLTERVATAVRACGSGAKVYASSTGTRASNAFVTNYPAYLRALGTRGWPVDGYTVHSYPAADGGPKQRVEELAQFKTLLAQNGAPVRAILDTELNYGLAGLGQDRRALDPATGAAYLSTSFIQSVQYGVDSLFWFLWTQADYDKLGIQLNAGTPETIQAWQTTYGWLVGSTMTQCAQGQELNACQLRQPDGHNMTLMWTDGATVNVNIDGLGGWVQRVTGEASPAPFTGVIQVGISPVAVREHM